MAEPVNQEVVVTVDEIGPPTSNGVYPKKIYVYSLMEEVTVDNPVEVTDRPTINSVEARSNRLMARTLSFRVKAAAGVYSLRKSWGLETNVIYQEDPEMRRTGLPDESVMVQQVNNLRALRNQLVTVYSVVEPNFYGIVQNVEFVKSNKSRTVVGATVTVREVLRGAVASGNFSFIPFDPSLNPEDDETTEKALAGNLVTFNAFGRMLNLLRDDSEKAENPFRVLDRDGTLRAVDPPNLLSASLKPALIEFQTVADAYDALTFPQKLKFVPTSAWILHNFSSNTQNATEMDINVNCGGVAFPTLRIFVSAKNGQDTEWRMRIRDKEEYFVNSAGLFVEDVFSDLFLRSFNRTSIATSQDFERGNVSGVYASGVPDRYKRVDAIVWMIDTSLKSYEPIVATERYKTGNLRIPKTLGGMPKVGEIGGRYQIAIVFGVTEKR